MMVRSKGDELGGSFREAESEATWRVEQALRRGAVRLDLREVGIRRVPEAVSQLTSLTDLDLSFNEIGTVPEGLRRLKNLRNLSLAGCHIQTVPHWIGQLTQLRSLNLMLNRLESLPDSLGDLMLLEVLLLDDNPLPQLSPVLFNFKQLRLLSIMSATAGRITEIPRDILQLDRLQTLRVAGQPIEIPPPEIVKQGTYAIRNYWRQQDEVGVDYLCEAKLLIVGEAGAGKTSLAKKICDRR
jgi:hypothetical protein